jgi:hypothetical protein
MPHTRIGSAALLALVSATTLGAQQAPWPPAGYLRPAVFGEIRDSSSGRPVGGVWHTVEGQIGLGRAWPDGRYLLFDMKPGTRVVNLYCPTTRRLRGRKIAERSVKVSQTTDSLVNFTIDTRGCAEPKLRSWSGELSGHYTYGFESSDFVPCAPFENLHDTAYQDGDQRAWVSFKSGAFERLTRKWPDTQGEQYPKLYVRWRASVEGPGSYGHLGVALYAMTVHEVLDVRRARDGDCR